MGHCGVQAGAIWTGSDSGLVYLTRDGGRIGLQRRTAKEVMPEWIQIKFDWDYSPSIRRRRI
jgi:hypothetical protein